MATTTMMVMVMVMVMMMVAMMVVVVTCRQVAYHIVIAAGIISASGNGNGRRDGQMMDPYRRSGTMYSSSTS